MEFSYRFFLDLAIILFSTKLLGTLMRRLGLPQVVGALIAGLIIGPVAIGIVSPSSPLKAMAEIGVVLLMFSAGLETNIKEMKKNGVASVVITMLGVIVPLGLGFAISGAFHGFSKDQLYVNLFYGIILTATSVGITVATLKEMGKLKGKVGASILSAAIIDDIIGIVLLSVIIGVSSEGSEVSVGMTLLNVFLFFLIAVVVGIGLHYLFKFLAKKYPKNRRVPIFSLAICFLFAWAAEHFFNIADITGAYIAGIMLSNIKTTDYVDRKIDINSYMIFSPVFFASIGINAEFTGFTIHIVWFALAFIAVGIASKFIGCGLGARMCGYSNIDSVRVGIGMVARGEVCLIMANKGIEAGVIEPAFLPAIILFVIATSLVTPILLKLTYRGKYAEPFDTRDMGYHERPIGGDTAAVVEKHRNPFRMHARRTQAASGQEEAHRLPDVLGIAPSESDAAGQAGAPAEGAGGAEEGVDLTQNEDRD